MAGLLLVLASMPKLACAQDETRPKRPPPRPPIQTVIPDAKPAASHQATVLALPPPLAPNAAFASGGFGSGGFASGALRSNLPVVGDAAPVCRATCAKTRYVCLATDDAAQCDQRWTQCVADCSR